MAERLVRQAPCQGDRVPAKYCIGNLKSDSVHPIMRTFETNANLGLSVRFQCSPTLLAERYGGPTAQRIHSGTTVLVSLYTGLGCAASPPKDAARLMQDAV